jgi:uncharacterized iron-regulated membrane protein|tara:strand:+ start:212 stop:481 length:270 start_codon:yes stop_codon:yes gene_type:complete
MSKTKTRKLHRSITLIAVIPLFITVLSGSLYSLFQYFGLDYFWLMKVHTGNFFLMNLQPIFSPVVGFLTIFAILSGLLLFPRSKIKHQD